MRTLNTWRFSAAAKSAGKKFNILFQPVSWLKPSEQPITSRAKTYPITDIPAAFIFATQIPSFPVAAATDEILADEELLAAHGLEQNGTD